MIIFAFLIISIISAEYPVRTLVTSAARGNSVGYDGYLVRERRDLIYWNRTTNGFRKYGRNRSKSDKNDETENLMSQIRKYYLQKESENPEKIKMIKNIISSLENSDKNNKSLNISAFVTKN